MYADVLNVAINMVRGIKGVGERQRVHMPPHIQKWGAHVGLYPHTFRHWAMQLGTDCQTKSAFLLPI